jgi:transcriptional regulator with XRE-family HTH domain
MRGMRRKAPKINQRMIYRIKELRAQQKTQEEIAIEIGVAQGTVSIILRQEGLGGHLKKDELNGKHS